MSSVNKVILVGNVGADPEIKTFSNGGKIANVRLATSESWKDKQTGERKERTEWHSLVFQSDGLVGVVERFVAKGSKIYVEGQLRTRKWQDQAGNDRYSTEVQIGGPNAKLVLLGEKQGGSARASGGSSGTGTGWAGSPETELDDDIPF